MTGSEVLIRQMNGQQEKLLKLARRVPTEKLDWVPATGCRTALDQLQECATAVRTFAETFKNAKIEFAPDAMEKWEARKAALTTLGQIETAMREDTAWLANFTASLSPEDLEKVVPTPWGLELNLMDHITFHFWNLAYHEGAITQILLQLGVDPRGE